MVENDKILVRFNRNNILKSSLYILYTTLVNISITIVLGFVFSVSLYPSWSSSKASRGFQKNSSVAHIVY